MKFKSLLKLNLAPMLSQEQNMLQEIFNGRSFWGLEEDCLPKIEGSLMPDRVRGVRGKTAELFGF